MRRISLATTKMLTPKRFKAKDFFLTLYHLNVTINDNVKGQSHTRLEHPLVVSCSK